MWGLGPLLAGFNERNKALVVVLGSQRLAHTTVPIVNRVDIELLVLFHNHLGLPCRSKLLSLPCQSKHLGLSY